MSFLENKYLIKTETGLAIYNVISKLPIVDPHNHANVAEIVENKNYSDPWQLFAATDHYVWEVLRKRDVPEEYITGKASPKEKWLKMAQVFPDFAGNPVYEWIHLDLQRYLGIDTMLGPNTGDEIWSEAKAVLGQKTKRPQQLLKEMKVEVMCSTDDPLDTLEKHAELNKIMKSAFVRPTWRPDKAMNIFAKDWPDYIARLEARFETKIKSVGDLLEVLKKSHDYFAENGCVSSDHGVVVPFAGDATLKEADAVFKKAISREPVSGAESAVFMSHVFGAVAEMDAARDWVFQAHIGAVRDVRESLFKSLGPDSGGDVSNHYQDILPPLGKFLNRFDGKLKVVLYCLDAGHQATLATMSRAFGSKVRLGSAWWLNDHPVGMRRQLEYIASVDLLANFAGMVSDSRKLLSFGSRFEMFRRIMADVLGGMVNLGQMPYSIAERLAKKMAYAEPKEFFRL